jgi:hypothetical protein
MPSCPGRRTKNNSSCNKTLYRCKKCGNVGCDYSNFGECTNQGFQSGKCLKCGAYDRETFR